MNKFAAMGWVKITEEDDFKDGCIGKTVMDGGHETFTAPTLDKLIEQCANFVGAGGLEKLLVG